MDPEDLADHIAKLDATANELEALSKALELHSDSAGTPTIGEIVAKLKQSEPARAWSLLLCAQALVEQGSSLGSKSTYFIEFGHDEVHKRRLALHRAMRLPRVKLYAGTQAFVTGRHSVDEDPAIADLRAQEIAEYLRRLLPPSRTITVRPHVCSAFCKETGDTIHIFRRVEVRICMRAKYLTVSQVQRAAQLTRDAHRSFSDLAAGRREEERAPDPREISPERQSKLDAEKAELIDQWAPLHALWLDLQPYREQFKYESVGTLVSCVEQTDPERARRIAEKLDAIISDPMTPHALASVTGATLVFDLQTENMEDGQETAITNLLSEIDLRDGGTSVVVSAWHEKDEEPALAGRRAWYLLTYLKLRAHANVRFKMQPHVCSPNCSDEKIPVMRRVGWVDVCWQSRYVLLEDIRIADVIGRTWLQRISEV